ncbi:hypothetical protein JCM24511_03535 [Saitozyma sp. JCM 24511]|nr:hypothetical protein JCM24511_03535 [Saitozyma sp. JCM 24511]
MTERAHEATFTGSVGGKMNIGSRPTHLNGTSSFSSSSESSRPYHGQMTKICDEYEMKEMRRTVKPTL